MTNIDRLEAALASRDKMQQVVTAALNKICDVGTAKSKLFGQLFLRRRLEFPYEHYILSVEEVEEEPLLKDFELMGNCKIVEHIAVMLNFMSIPEKKIIEYENQLNNIIKSADAALLSITNLQFRTEYETSPGTFVYQ